MVHWLAQHSEVLEGHENEWVAIPDERAVPSGEDFGDVADAATAQGHDDPLLVPVFPLPFP